MEDCGDDASSFVPDNIPEDIPLPTLNADDLKCKDTNTPQILDPDHPLMQRFQQSLKEYLLRTKAQLTEEISELKYNIKVKETERDEHGVQLYDLQQEIKRQNKLLEEYTEDIQKINEQRMNEEKSLEKQKSMYEEKENLSKQQKMSYNQRMVDLTNLQGLENNIRQWAKEIEDEISSSQRIASRDAQLQRTMAEEKKKYDIFYYNLDLDVRKREAELQDILDEIANQSRVIETLKNSLSDANADLEVLKQEQKKLSQSWSDVIIAITQRDKLYNQARGVLDKEIENYKLLCFDIEGTKKQIVKENEKRKKLETFKQRLAKDYTNLKIECQKQSQILSRLEMRTDELPKFLEQSERDFQEARKEGIKLDAHLRTVQTQTTKNYNKKKQLEEDILRMAQDNLITDKASGHRLKLLSITQEQRRVIELNLAQNDNELANLLLEIEKSKNTALNLQEEGERLKTILQSAQDEYDTCNKELKTVEFNINEKINRIEKLTQILDKLIQDAEGDEMSPTEKKIKELEKGLQEKEQAIRDAQEFWLMLQGHYVHLSTKRNNQLNEIHMTTKQMALINQKSLKIDDKIEKLEAAAREIQRDIHKLTTTFDVLSAKLLEKKSKHEAGQQECEILHSDLLDMLKNNEMRVLNLEKEITQLDDDIFANKEIALELHRETLSWETKYKLVEETLRWRKNEQQRDSEIGIMKAEIHRMQVRYNQLKRAQEKLIQDMDHCVMHREQIFITALTKQKLLSNPKQSKRSQPPSRKIADLQSKLKQVQDEIVSLNEKELAGIRKDREQIQNEISELKNILEQETQQNHQIENEIEEKVMLKQLNLETIIRNQNRAKFYRRLNCDDVAAKLPKSQITLEINMQKQNELNKYMWDLAQTLITEFPDKKNILNRISQILRD